MPDLQRVFFACARTDQRSWRRYAIKASGSSCFMSTAVIPPLVILLAGPCRSAMSCASVYFWPTPVRGPGCGSADASVTVAGVARPGLKESQALQHFWIGRNQGSRNAPCSCFRDEGLLHKGFRIGILLAHLGRHSWIFEVIPIAGNTERRIGKQEEEKCTHGDWASPGAALKSPVQKRRPG